MREKTPRRLRAAGFAGAIAVHDAAFGEVVGRHLEIDAVAGENLDPVAPEAAGDVGQDRLAVLQLDRERRTRKDLLDRAEQLERRFLRRLLGRARARCAAVVALILVVVSAGYDATALPEFIRDAL